MPKAKPKSEHIPMETRMEKQRRQKIEFAAFLKTLGPQFSHTYQENGITIKVYSAGKA